MDNAKIDEIYRKNAAIIYKYLCGLTQNPQMAEDLTQETFFQAIRESHGRSFRQVRSFLQMF